MIRLDPRYTVPITTIRNSRCSYLEFWMGKHSVLDKNYDFMIPYYNMVLAQEDDGICMKYPDIKTEGLHYSAAFTGGNIAMMNMGKLVCDHDD